MAEIEVIVPTYREAANLPVLLDRLLETFDRNKLDASVLVVDDDSQDGTEEAVKPFLGNGRVRLFTRRGERGLATAVLEGFRRSESRYFVVCDADLSHPVESIPQLLAPLRNGEAEMTLGSRYVPGGEDMERSILRRWASRAAGLLARPLVSVKDPASGFFAAPREVVQREPLDPLGFKIAIEILVRCRVKRFVEVPIRFVDRVSGRSKMDAGAAIAYLLHLQRLLDFQRPRLAQFLRFSFVGTLGLLVDTSIFTLGYKVAGLDYLLAQAISFSAGATHNFLWHRHWTFPHGKSSQPMSQYVAFLLVALAALGIRSLVMAWLVEKQGWNPYPALAVGVILVLMLNFLGSRHLVFRKAST